MLLGTMELNELAATFRERLPDDTGVAQLGLLLIHDLRAARRALVEAAIPLEVMAGQIAARPYREIAPEVQDGILNAVAHVRAAVTPTPPEEFPACSAL